MCVGSCPWLALIGLLCLVAAPVLAVLQYDL